MQRFIAWLFRRKPQPLTFRIEGFERPVQLPDGDWLVYREMRIGDRTISEIDLLNGELVRNEYGDSRLYVWQRDKGRP